MGEFGKSRMDSKRNVSKAGNSFHKSSAVSIQKEIANVRKNVDSLREFLRGCQDSISAETAKLEKQCIGKIKHLEDENSTLRRRLELAVEEKDVFNRSFSESMQATRESESVVQNSRRESAELRAKVASLESGMEAKSDQCELLLKETEQGRLKCLQLENKLAASNAYVQEQKQVFKEMLSDQKQLQAKNSDLRMQISESEAYERALQDHVSELEGICSVLRDQLDEQQKYFLQKEMTIRKEGSDRYGTVLGEKKKLSNTLEQMQLQLDIARDDFEREVTSRKGLEKINKEKKEKLVNLEKNIETLQNELAIEKSTVAMLSQKNNELSIKLVQEQSEMRHLQDKLNDKLSSNGSALNRKAMKEVQNTIQQYFEGQKKTDGIIERELIASTNKKLMEFEKLLADERKLRLSSEIRAENLQAELAMAKAESADRNQHRGKSSGSKGRKSLKNSPYPERTVDYDGSYIEDCKITEDSNSSEITHKDDNGIGKKQASQLHGMSDKHTGEPTTGAAQSTLPSSNHSIPRLNLCIAAKRESLSSDSESITSFCEDFTVSPRVSQKLAEANKKALMLLHGLKKS